MDPRTPRGASLRPCAHSTPTIIPDLHFTSTRQTEPYSHVPDHSRNDRLASSRARIPSCVPCPAILSHHHGCLSRACPLSLRRCTAVCPRGCSCAGPETGRAPRGRIAHGSRWRPIPGAIPEDCPTSCLRRAPTRLHVLSAMASPVARELTSFDLFRFSGQCRLPTAYAEGTGRRGAALSPLRRAERMRLLGSWALIEIASCS